MKHEIYFGDRDVRFALGRSGNNPLFIVGINPSNADAYKSDPTIRKVEKLAPVWGYDGFVMLNLYPMRGANPETICKAFDDELASLNAKIVGMLVHKFKPLSIWAAWGDAIDLNQHFVNCVSRLSDLPSFSKISWLQCGGLTKNKNPRHPNPYEPFSRTVERGLQQFKFSSYLKTKLFKPR